MVAPAGAKPVEVFTNLAPASSASRQPRTFCSSSRYAFSRITFTIACAALAAATISETPKGTYTLAAANTNPADQSGAKKRAGTPRATKPGKRQPAQHDVAKQPAHPDQSVTPEPTSEPEAAREPVAEPAA